VCGREPQKLRSQTRRTRTLIAHVNACTAQLGHESLGVRDAICKVGRLDTHSHLAQALELMQQWKLMVICFATTVAAALFVSAGAFSAKLLS
jgi:hypothetical protein